MGRSPCFPGFLRVGALAVVGAVLLAGAPLASTLGHRCPPLAVPVGRAAPHSSGPGRGRTGRARRRRTDQADPVSLSRGRPALSPGGGVQEETFVPLGIESVLVV